MGNVGSFGKTQGALKREKYKWKEVSFLPGMYPIVCSNMVKINESECIVMSWYSYVITYRTYICKYNFKNNQWTQLFEYKDEKDKEIGWNRKVLSFDKATNKLWMFAPVVDNLTILDINNEKINNIIKHTAHSMSIRCHSGQSLIINGKYHYFGGIRSKYHQIWDEKQCKFIINHTFYHWNEGLVGFGLVYVKSMDCVFLFGGCDQITNTESMEIWKYMISQNKWIKLNANLPFNVSHCGYILTPDERYIVWFGGVNKTGVPLDNVIIWNLETTEFCLQNKVKCPEGGRCCAILSHNNFDKHRNLKIYGYLRDCWKLNGLKGLLFLSKDLIELIDSFVYYHGTVSLTTLGSEERNWIIPLDDVLNNQSVRWFVF